MVSSSNRAHCEGRDIEITDQPIIRLRRRAEDHICTPARIMLL
jgi:hypothetical protein